jgi:hypothetical protein
MKSNMSKDFKRKAGLRQCYYDGGRVTGPGTGTSDSVDARLSDGEYVLPADTVRHVGKENLDDLKNATHTPVNRAVRRITGASGEWGGATPGYEDGGYMHHTSKYNQTGSPTSMADGGFLPDLRTDAKKEEDARTARVQAGTGSPEDTQLESARQNLLRDTNTPFDTPVVPFTLGLSGARAAAGALGDAGSAAGRAVGNAASAAKDFIANAVSRLRGAAAPAATEAAEEVAPEVARAATARAAQTTAPGVAQAAAPEVAAGYTRDAAGRITQVPVASQGTVYGAGTAGGGAVASAAQRLLSPKAAIAAASFPAAADELYSHEDTAPAQAPRAPQQETGSQFLERIGVPQNVPAYKAKTLLGQLGSGFIGNRAAFQMATALRNQNYNEGVRAARLNLEQRKFNYEQGEKGADRLGNLLNDTFQTYDDKGKPIGPDKVAQEGFKDFVAQSDPRFRGLSDTQLQQKLNQLDPQDQAKLVSQFKGQYKVNKAINNIQGQALFGGRVTNRLDRVADIRPVEYADITKGLPVLDAIKAGLNPWDAGILHTVSDRVARVSDIASNPSGHGFDQDIIDALEKQSGKSTGLRRGQ